jgi:hypothetical protein
MGREGKRRGCMLCGWIMSMHWVAVCFFALLSLFSILCLSCSFGVRAWGFVRVLRRKIPSTLVVGLLLFALLAGGGGGWSCVGAFAFLCCYWACLMS